MCCQMPSDNAQEEIGDLSRQICNCKGLRSRSLTAIDSRRPATEREPLHSAHIRKVALARYDNEKRYSRAGEIRPYLADP